MGSKFCNLNVYGAEPAAVKAYCPGCAVQAFTPAWTTAAGECLTWETLPKTARGLSKALSVPVLSTAYFDDDYVEFVLYRDGKRAARHIPAAYEGYARKAGKPGDWAEALGLSSEQENTLKIIFKEKHPETSLHLLECVLGCPLWADAETITDAAGETVTEDNSYLEAYLARKNAERKMKIKNQTKLTLLDEKPSNAYWELTDLIITQPYDKQTGQHFLAFWEIRDGRFHPLFQHPIHKQVFDFYSSGRVGDTLFLAYGIEAGQNSQNNTIYQDIIHIFSADGTVLDEICIKTRDNFGTILEEFCFGKSNPRNISFLDGDRLFADGWCWNFRTHQKEWELDIGNSLSGISPPCRLSNGRLASVYNRDDAGFLFGLLRGGGKQRIQTNDTGFLTSFLPDGSGQIVQKLPSPRHWESPVSLNENLFMGYEEQLSCYNSALEELWHVTFDDLICFSGEQILDADMKMLYMGKYRGIIAFDLQKREIHAVREFADNETFHLCDFLPGIGPVVLTGNSSLEVWNPELQPISRHRARGQIDSYWSSILRAFIHQEGKTYLLTRTDPYNKPFILRLYELKPPKTV